MAIFAEVTENECIIYRHLRGIHPLRDYDASESQSIYDLDLIEIGLSALWLSCKMLISILCSSRTVSLR